MATSTLEHPVSPDKSVKLLSPDKSVKLIFPGILSSEWKHLDATASRNRDLGVFSKAFTLGNFW